MLYPVIPGHGGWGGGGVLANLGCTGKCCWTGYGFVVSLFSIGCTILFASVLINRVKACSKQDMVLLP